MNNLAELFPNLLQTDFFPDMLIKTFIGLNDILAMIDWVQIMKIAIFVALAAGMTITLLVVTEKVFDKFNAQRIKKHHLTIRNNGNVPSIFLFRAVDLPKQLAIRFRIGDIPMIWASRRKAADPQPEAVKAEEAKQAPEQNKSKDPGLVPDLKDPFSEVKDTAGKTINTARKTAANVGRTAGLFAGIIGSVTNLLGIKAPGLQQAQGALKDVQQQSNQTIQAVNSKLGTVDTLTNQVNSVVPKSPFPDAAKAAVQDMGKAGTAPETGGADLMTGSTMNISRSGGVQDFVFDEEVWHQNLGQLDEEGGELNYAMSKTIEPGESISIDLDIMNLSSSSAPVSLMYKIEVLQIPQTKMRLAAPKEYINGIVIYPKIPLMSRIIPNALIVALIVISLQILAGYSHFIF